MKLKFCNCRMCKAGKKKYGNPEMIRHEKKKWRHKVKTKLKHFKTLEELDDLPESISIPYTD